MAAFSVIGSGVAGCLKSGGNAGDSNNLQNSDGKNNTDMNDTPDGNGLVNGNRTDDGSAGSTADNDQDGIRKSHFGVRGTDFEFDVSAAATFDGDSVTVQGTIQGTNTCYTAKLDELTVENQTLLVNIVSYEDPDEGEVCGEALIGIGYEVVIEFDSEVPAEVTVQHDGQHVTSERSP